MTAPNLPLEEAINAWDRASTAEPLERAAEQRARVLRLFPLNVWPDLPLERYVLGTGSKETFSYLMEFATQDLGGIGGGSAHKHLVYRKADGDWYFDRRFQSIDDAWPKVRAGFVRAFELAEAGDMGPIAELEPINWAPALTSKAVFTYFPDRVVNVASHAARQHFWELLGGEGTISYNATGGAELLALCRSIPALADLSTAELGLFLYWWADPKESKRVLKIAPGPEAKYWDDCLAGGYACVGWDEVGNLAEFESKDEFRARFQNNFSEWYGTKSKLSAKANEVWKLRELEPGDIVIANKGTSHVLAIGTVVDPGYEWRPEREEMRHTVKVDWDTSYEQSIAPVKSWATVTVADVAYPVLKGILDHTPVDPVGEPRPPDRRPPQVPVPALLEDLGEALERKGQVVLYGPPGTGKTYHANRFAAWWLPHKDGQSTAANVLVDDEALAAANRRLTTTRVVPRVWWVVANPSEWSWSSLFDKGPEDFRYGRLRANYERIRPGDLVVGYQSQPDKKIMALARISEGLHDVDGEPMITLEGVTRVANGPSYEELTRDPVLSVSEPMRNRNQGTLFSLSPEQATYALSLLAERNPGTTAFDVGDSDIGRLTRVTFHPSYTYEDFVEGYRPIDTGTGELALRMTDGIFKRVCRTATRHPDSEYVLLIDEINRGNIPKIFGELITLLELDKRDITVVLPQSGEPFSVPPNVHIVGTMNTADRSIKLLDAALRRRFAFIELMPQPDTLSGGVIGGLDLDVFLAALNDRIAEYEGREKQIGHSYLLGTDGQPVSDATEFSRRFRHEILPLLQEYAYDDYAELSKYVGPGIVDASGKRLKSDVLQNPDQLIEALRKSFMEKGGEEEAAEAPGDGLD